MALALWQRDWRPIASVWEEQAFLTLLPRGQENQLVQKPEFIGSDHEVLHPYLGFVREPQVPVGTGAYYGFLEAPNTWIHRQRDDAVVVGIFGGSVANFFFYDGGEELIAVLKRNPVLTGKTIELVPFSMGGWKQPQQLLALNYYLSLGGHLDIAINLDGFNELVLPAYENIPKGVFPFYPRSWFFRVLSEEKSDLLPIIGQLSYLKQKRSEWVGQFTRQPLRYSATMGFLWKVGDTYLARKIGRREHILLRPQPVMEQYVVAGPRRLYKNDEEMMQDVVDQWGRNSLLMERVSRANGIQYFHFLQPTGRYIGSKPLTAGEREIVFAGAFPPTDLVNTGYPLLQKKGAELQASGVQFTDLSMLFKGTHKKLYYDMCHVEAEGSKMMARAIAESILRSLRE